MSSNCIHKADNEWCMVFDMPIGKEICNKYCCEYEKKEIVMSSKLREALEKFSAVDLSGLKFPLDGDSSAIYNSDKKEITIPYWRVAELLNEVKVAQDMAKSAVSEPLKNCEVGSEYPLSSLMRCMKFQKRGMFRDYDYKPVVLSILCDIIRRGFKDMNDFIDQCASISEAFAEIGCTDSEELFELLLKNKAESEVRHGENH